ncbi:MULTISPECIES: LysR family transcriptional regulator [unclassified Luteococcus]|uniref:LysR family transcriptional regulator n=1 Tax=unclassified Luteococcus TaxID=2639923 RepID=UPI00313E3081
MDAEIRHLRALVEIVESGSISAAARHLGIGQPALSRTLAQLERIVGVELASRGSAGLTLTAAGRRLLPEAQAAVAAFDAAIRCLDSSDGVAMLGFSWLLPSWLPGELDEDLRRGDPGFRLRLQRTEQPVSDVLAGRLHGCVLREPSSREGLVATPIATEARMLAIAHDSAHQAAIGASWAALGSQPLVVNRATGTTQASLWTPPARVAASCSNFDEWQAYVAADRGIGVVPALAAELAPHPGIQYHRIPDAPAVTVAIVCRSQDRRPATLALSAWAEARRISGAS